MLVREKGLRAKIFGDESLAAGIGLYGCSEERAVVVRNRPNQSG